MNSARLNKFGGTCAILLGLSYFVIGAAFLLDPVLKAANSNEYYTILGTTPFWHVTLYAAFVASGLLGLLATWWITGVVIPPEYKWLRVVSIFAYIGFAATMLDNLLLLLDHPARALAYIQADQTQQALLISRELNGFDRQGWMGFGCIGLWVLIISVVALWKGLWPRLLCAIGIVVTILYWLVLAGNVTDLSGLVSFGAMAGGIILAPVWYIWVGLILRRHDAAVTPQPQIAMKYTAR